MSDVRAVPEGLSREGMVLRLVRELRDGFYINLGVGLPQLVANYLPPEMKVFLHAENGVLCYGPHAELGQEDPDVIDAGADYITELPGVAYFDSDLSFRIIRGGHLDLAILGGLQVSEGGDLANWLIPERKAGSVGGAMDLVTGAKRVLVAMDHVTKSGEPKILKQCSYPLTGRRCVNTIFTNLAVIEVSADGLILKEVAPSVTPEEVQALTEPRLIVAEDVKQIEV